jgi:hypothetical protein
MTWSPHRMSFWGLYLDPLYMVLFFATLFIAGGAQPCVYYISLARRGR